MTMTVSADPFVRFRHSASHVERRGAGYKKGVGAIIQVRRSPDHGERRSRAADQRERCGRMRGPLCFHSRAGASEGGPIFACQVGRRIPRASPAENRCFMAQSASLGGMARLGGGARRKRMGGATGNGGVRHLAGERSRNSSDIAFARRETARATGLSFDICSPEATQRGEGCGDRESTTGRRRAGRGASPRFRKARERQPRVGGARERRLSGL